MKVAVYSVIALIMILALLTSAANGDRSKRVTNTAAIITATCIIALLYLINS